MWAKENINFIKVLTNDEENIMSYNDFTAKFDFNINNLNYYTLIDTIPEIWKSAIQLQENPLREVRNSFITKLKGK